MSELANLIGLSSADIEDLKISSTIGEHEKVSVRHIFDIHKITKLVAIFIDRDRLAPHSLEHEDAQSSGVKIPGRLPGTLNNRISHDSGRNAVGFSQAKREAL
jgi:hypothetical protein